MKVFLIRRMLALVPLLLVVTFITQALLVLSPGDYFSMLAENPSVSAEMLESLRREYRLDTENVFVRYWHWLSQVVRGNFGYSFKFRTPVWSLVWERLFNTLLLAVAALVISWGLAIPIGILAAVRRNSWVDRLAGVVSFAGLSIPSVFFSLLMLLFAQKTGWFPTGGIHDQVYWDYFTPYQKVVDTLWHLTLPAVVLGTIGLAQYMRQMRSEMIETLGQDYIRTARAKGLSWRRVVFRHALGNAINPLVTLFGFSLAYLLTGSVLTEVVFAWPGMGRLTVQALLEKDEPLVMASIVMLTIMLALGSLVSDILLALIDPRIRLEGH